ncbi:hypothetical protein CROQUDRAFT_65528 [Cronartium quercuum f. sp. fusiforme G11]|uniref:Histone deacetylase interacting domain-containing protein n=1 Tax=Cronartium quercuum f. sp. fusiforme G11 TaxID=708437 RepID=A0A9P6NHZ2_9BASI|nr:hypothetical protein CROQUDRAFT_65528 [Cronartium quercuum f. sp. fusiforme G11]
MRMTLIDDHFATCVVTDISSIVLCLQYFLDRNMSQAPQAASGTLLTPSSAQLLKTTSSSTGIPTSQSSVNAPASAAGTTFQSFSLPPQQTNPPAPPTMAAHNYRPLNVRDALSYLDQVKLQFQELPGVYNQFLDIMKDFKTQTIDTPGVIDGVSSLFRGHPALIQGFNTFLPPGYRIDVTQGEGLTQAGVQATYNLITVTHPMGIQTQKRVPLHSGGEEIGSHNLPPDSTTAPVSTVAPAVAPVLSTDRLTRDNVNSLPFNGPSPRTIAPDAPTSAAGTSMVASAKTKPVTLDVVANHNLAPNRTNSPALSNTTSTDASKSTVKPLEFNHAITYVNKIKNRYSGDPKTYQTFLDILQTYQRDARPIQEVYEQVNHLFRDEPDLMVEFMQFLPDTSGNAPQPSLSNPNGLLGVCNSAGAVPHDDRKNPSQLSNQSKPVNPVVKKKRNGANTAASNKATAPGGSRPATLEANGSRHPNPDTTRTGASAPVDPSPLRGVKRKARVAPNPASDNVASATAPIAGQPPPGFAPPGYRSIGEAYHTTLTSNRALALENCTSRDTPRRPIPGQTHDSQGKQIHSTNQLPKRVIAKEELVFFHHVKTYFADQTTYIEFLKIINLFTQDLIDLNILVSKIKPFLINCPDLWSRFTDVVGWREDSALTPSKRKGSANGLPEPKKPCHRPALNTRPVSGSDAIPDCGPSYRQVPESDVTVACSGRDALCSDVLNDRWVCGPPGLSADEQLFTPRQTNAFERALYQAEDERHEYDYHIEANVRTIALLEPINLRIQQMDPEHRAEYRLKPGLGGQSKSIYQRIIKKIYGKEHGVEVIRALHDNPALAVPIVLARLKQKDEEWKKALRDWNRVWREVDGKNYWKALDHQGISFKAVDKKLIGNKNLINEIELIKREQQQKRQLSLNPSIIQFLPKFQLELDLSDTDVFYDVLKVFIHFLDHVPNSTGLDDRHKDRIESFLKSVLTSFFDIPIVELERHLTPLPPERKGQEGVNGLGAKNIDGDGNETACSDGDVSDRAGSPTQNAAGDDDRLETSNGRPNRATNGTGRKRGGAKDGPSGIGDLRKKAMKNASHNGPLINERASARRSEANRTKATTAGHSRSATKDTSSSHQLSLNTHLATDPHHRFSNARTDGIDPGALDMPTEIQTSSVRDEGPEPTEGNVRDVLAQFPSTSSDAKHHSGQNFSIAPPDKPLNSAPNNPNDVPPFSELPPLHYRPNNALAKQRRHNFFTNNAFYCLLRLMHIMYTRLYTLKKASESIYMCPTPTSSTSHPPDQVAELPTINGTTSSQSSSASSAVSPSTTGTGKSKHENYFNLLTCIQSLNSGQMDQSSFEDECRTLFGVKGYSVITIDKLCQALVKVLAKLCNDETCKEILRLYETQKSLEKAAGPVGLTESQKLSYRRSVEALTGGTDTKLFRIEWLTSTHAMRIQLIGSDDINPEDYEAVEKAWSTYIESYGNMSVERTIGLGDHEIKPAFLKRNVRLVRKALGPIDANMFFTQAGLGVRVCMRSYRLFFSANTSDILFRKRIATAPKPQPNGIVVGEKEDGEVVEEEKKAVDVDVERMKRWEKWIANHSRLPPSHL